MNERIKKIRKESGCSMETFGKKLGVSKSAVSQWESGVNKVSEQAARLICNEFNVNYDWLSTGKGEPYKTRNTSIATYVSEIAGGDDDFIKDLIITYMELDEASKEAIRVLAKRMADKRNKREQT